MIDAHERFLFFEEAITPANDCLERGLQIRSVVRHHIWKSCCGKGLRVAFHPQGSFRLLTAVERSGLDLDDGILFKSGQFDDDVTIECLHTIIFDALRGSEFDVVARHPCIRVVQRGNIRIDLVLYLERENGSVHLAHRRDGWVPSHSSDLIYWFERQPQGLNQKCRYIKYYKAWAARLSPAKVPSGVAITILISTFAVLSPRDDLGFLYTMESILRHLENGGGCMRPTPPKDEELLGKELTPKERVFFLAHLRDLVRQGKCAINAPESAHLYWERLFGPLFIAATKALSSQLRATGLRDVLTYRQFNPKRTAEDCQWTS